MLDLKLSWKYLLPYIGNVLADLFPSKTALSNNIRAAFAEKKAVQPKVSLVGAGPGDIELITLKGINAIKSADVILYDALVAKELLDYAPAHTEKVFVGKRANNHAFKQDEINEMIVKKAKKYGHLVRLKGGDSFIFGRGHEEMEYAKAYDIPVNIIPGISSVYAVPELQHIPLTRRGVNDSFWVTTGTTSDGSLSDDFYAAAKTNATVVVLMGMNKLDKIVEIYKKQGKKDLPVAIIQNGSLPNEKIGIGTIDNIRHIAEREKLGAPSIIVLGEVVALHPTFLRKKTLYENMHMK